MESFSSERTTTSITISVVPKNPKCFSQTWIKPDIYVKNIAFYFTPQFFSLVTLAGVENIDDNKNPANQIH